MNGGVLLASCRQRNLRTALPTRRRQHLLASTSREITLSLSVLPGECCLIKLSQPENEATMSQPE